MAALVEVLNQRDPALQCFANSNGVLRDDIPVVESVRHEYGAFDVLGKTEKVSFSPELVVVSGSSVLVCGENSVAVELDPPTSVCRISTVDEVEKRIDVLAEVTARASDQAV